ncbi:unnamed protein product [Bursaphelenchus okinawaensis]|uniref:MFS domain-containing protein n=1 Tax=Bursaphelenchus okinawaensis TaxID=465554 RepID=A0A811L881_9BILA|nr:unnamed protein product [Bursaphelenchus okinawaensis]CAG9119812.1 unnamed protein product [Bursaphelenchus okinawaensis]
MSGSSLHHRRENNGPELDSGFFTNRRIKKEPEQYKRFEDVIEQVDPLGRYQLFACFCILFAQIEWTGNLSFVNIVGSTEPNWICDHGNYTTHIPQPTKNHCEEVRLCPQLKAVKDSSEFNSIVASFHLICDDANKPQIINIIQSFSLVCKGGDSHLGDAFGRQFMFYVCQLAMCITSCLIVASTGWQGFAAAQFFNGIFYGLVEVESLTLLMEITNDQFRMIPNACFQTNLANVVVAFIAFMTKDWQMFFIFLNLVNLPTCMAFMLWHESPRWLLIKGETASACDVLNDLTDHRWNGTQVKFTPRNLEKIPTDTSKKFYSFYDLFSNRRFAKQSLLQIVSMITCAVVSVCYMRVIREFNGSSILIVLLDGCVRLIIPILVIFADIKFESFTRRIQFLLALSLMGINFMIGMILVICGVPYNSVVVTVFVTLGAMINDSVLWMNIIQVTTQRYPTVIRCCAFGSVFCAKHIGTIIGLVVIPPILDSAFPGGAFLLPLLLILITLVLGGILMPETKGKALLDTMDDVDYTRVEKALPKTLVKMAALHRVMHQDRQKKINEENKERYDEWKKELHNRQGDTNAAFEENVTDSE